MDDNTRDPAAAAASQARMMYQGTDSELIARFESAAMDYARAEAAGEACDTDVDFLRHARHALSKRLFDKDREAQNLRDTLARTDMLLVTKRERVEALERELRDLCLCFTPQAIRDHFDGQAYDEDPVARAIEGATNEQLEAMGAWALESDALYREFHDSLVAAAEEVLGVQP